MSVTLEAVLLLVIVGLAVAYSGFRLAKAIRGTAAGKCGDQCSCGAEKRPAHESGGPSGPAKLRTVQENEYHHRSR